MSLGGGTSGFIYHIGYAVSKDPEWIGWIPIAVMETGHKETVCLHLVQHDMHSGGIWRHDFVRVPRMRVWDEGRKLPEVWRALGVCTELMDGIVYPSRMFTGELSSDSGGPSFLKLSSSPSWVKSVFRWF
jgi:hypothetical protein